MKLDNPVTVRPHPYTDNATNKIITPEPMIIDELRITYYDQPHLKILGAQIEKIPQQLTLFFGPEYDALGDNRSLEIYRGKLKTMMCDNPEAFLQNLFPRTLEADPDGAGTILSGMISVMGIKSTANCSCRRHALEMNAKGPDWCEENLGTILGWLEEEGKKRNLPFVRTVAKMMVQRSINKSRRLLAKSHA
jgi:hypothetical protein